MPQPELGGLLNAAASGLSTLGDRALKPLKLTSTQWKVLVVLARRGDSRISDLVRVLNHDQAAVSRLVARMERAGLVRRASDPDDARAGRVSLTARGRTAYQRCDTVLRSVMNHLQSALRPAERAELRRLLIKFTGAIDSALDQRPPR
jgi:DNA-binding MarR family transcriptional regulator